ncbi:MAG: T9SS type A sorting domain-containing protein [Flavobacteriia bacterium]|nr:T9SS type A sorting domain-containing protein [Flavobacteriia bacterium]
MKKILFSLALIGGLTQASAQLPAGSFAPDFTVTAYQPGLATAGFNNNGTYNLYDYLNAGYTVFLDVSATWCGPCWNYHTSNALDDLYAAHGPAGHPGVSSNTTNDVMVIWIEGDGTTADATMLDGAGTIGNWINPTGNHEIEFPMANPASAAANQINDDYAIGYFPTIYKICQDRILEEVGQATATVLYSSVSACPPPASATSDVKMLNSNGETSICGPANYTPKVVVQNYGTSNLTTASVQVTYNGNVVSTGAFTGNLTTYDVAEVVCSPIADFSGGILTAIVTTTGDANANNGSTTINVAGATQAADDSVYVEIVTDQYGSETTWTLKDASGATVLSGGPYTDLGASGTAAQAIQSAKLTPTSCYTFTINDAYGDGIDSGYGAGTYTVKDGSNNILASGGAFASSESKPFKSGSTSGAGLETVIMNSLSVYPNPTTGDLTIYSNELKQFNTIELVDQIGKTLSTWEVKNENMNITLKEIANGTYHLVFKGNSGKYIHKIQVNK